MKLLMNGEIRDFTDAYGLRLVEQGQAIPAPAATEEEPALTGDAPAETGNLPEEKGEETKPKSRSRKKTGKVSESEPEG